MEVTPRNFPKGEWRGFPRENGGDAAYVTEGNALGLKSFPEPRNASPTGIIWKLPGTFIREFLGS
jgi:hypothetical protein